MSDRPLRSSRQRPESAVSALRLIAADIFTTSYRLSGKVAAPSTGLIGHLNNPTTSFVDFEDVYFSPIHQPGRISGHYGVVRLVKSNIAALLLTRRDDVGPVALVRGGYTRIVSTPALVACGIFEVQGLLESPGKFDFNAALVEGAGQFFALYDASLAAVPFPEANFRGAACLINKSRVDLITFREEKRGAAEGAA